MSRTSSTIDDEDEQGVCDSGVQKDRPESLGESRSSTLNLGLVCDSQVSIRRTPSKLSAHGGAGSQPITDQGWRRTFDQNKDTIRSKMQMWQKAVDSPDVKPKGVWKFGIPQDRRKSVGEEPIHRAAPKPSAHRDFQKPSGNDQPSLSPLHPRPLSLYSSNPASDFSATYVRDIQPPVRQVPPQHADRSGTNSRKMTEPGLPATERTADKVVTSRYEFSDTQGSQLPIKSPGLTATKTGPQPDPRRSASLPTKSSSSSKNGLSQNEYYLVSSVINRPQISEVNRSEFVSAVIPYMAQRVKMRAAFVLRPEFLSSLVVRETLRRRSCNMPNDKALTLREPRCLKLPISRIDCVTHMLGMADNIVVNDMLNVMAQFQMALPLILRKHEDTRCIVMASSMRGIVIKWEISSQGKNTIIEHYLFHDKFRMLAAVRLGENKTGKSYLLNLLFRNDHTFSSKGEPGSKYGKPSCLDGTVEMTWLTRETCKETFWISAMNSFYSAGENEITLMANVHGDVRDYPDIIAQLNKFSCNYLVFVMPNCSPDAVDNFFSKTSSDKVFCIYVDSAEDNEGDTCKEYDNEIRTSEILDESTKDKLHMVIAGALHSLRGTEYSSASTENPGKLLVCEALECPESRCLLDFVAERKCEDVKRMMKLQDHNAELKDRFDKYLRDNDNLRLIKLFMDVLMLCSINRAKSNRFELRNAARAAMIHIENNLSRLSNNESQTARDKVCEWKEELDELKKKNCENVKEIEKRNKQIANKMDEISDSNLGLEHLFREVCSLYEISRHPSLKIDDTNVGELPRCAADLFINGQALELLNGDSGLIPIVWLTALWEQIDRILPNLRVFVVSIIGLQSSGKSTLLNSLFACKFAVSVGRCSRGLFMRLLFLDKRLVQTHNFDAVLLIDTEGLGSPEKMNDPNSEKKDRLLATFAMGISNLTLINVMGENMNEITEILQVAIVTMTRLEKADISPDILMVQHLPEKNGHRTASALRQFNEALRRAINLVEEQNLYIGVRNVKCLEKLQERLMMQEFVIHFSPYRSGAAVNSPPSEQYSEDVVTLYNQILETGRTSKNVTAFKKWSSLICRFWECIGAEDFAVRFKNIKAMWEFVERGEKIAAVERAIDTALAVHEDRLEKELVSQINGQSREIFEAHAADNLLCASTRSQVSSQVTLCDECQEVKDVWRSLNSDIDGKQCEHEIYRTIDDYEQRARRGAVERLLARYGALEFQQKCSDQFNWIVNSHLGTFLDKSRIGSLTPDEIDGITNEIIKELEAGTLNRKPSASFEVEFIEELKSTYSEYPGVSNYFGKNDEKQVKFEDVLIEELVNSATSALVEEQAKSALVEERTKSRIGKLLHGIKNKFTLPGSKTQIWPKLLKLHNLLLDEPQKIIDTRKAESFQHGMVRDLRTSVNQKLKQFARQHKNTSKKVINEKIHIWMQQKLFKLVKVLQDKFDEHHNPLHILEAMRKRCKQVVETRLHIGFTCLAERDIIVQHIQRAIQQLAVRETNNKTIRSALALSWTKSSEKVRLKYFMELALEVDAGNNDRALGHFANPKEELKKWYKNKIDVYGAHKIRNAYVRSYCRECHSLCGDISSAKNMKDLVEVVELYLRKAGIVDYRHQTNLDDDNEEQFNIMQNLLLHSLQASAEPPDVHERAFVLPSRCSKVMERLGCTDICYWCQALCWGQRGHEQNSDDTRRHHTAHQPWGLSGISDGTTRLLYTYSCSEMPDNCNVDWGNDNDVGKPWSEAKAEYCSTWVFDGQCDPNWSKLMCWFFQKLHVDMAQCFGGEPYTDEDMRKLKWKDVNVDHIVANMQAQL